MKRFLILTALCLAFVVPAWAGFEETLFTPATGHSLSYSTTSTVSSTHLGSQTYVIRMWATADSFVAFEVTNGTVSLPTGPGILATAATGIAIPSFTVEYFGVQPNSYIAIRSSGATLGTVYWTEMTQ